MKKKPIISLFNLKSGVGCSALTWNIAHTLELNIYQHDKGMHDIFMNQRNQSVTDKKLYENHLTSEFINKRVFKSGVYDLGSDVNYPYVRQILNKSDVIVIPCELGYEVMLQTIASIKYAQQQNSECMIYVVFNKLDNADPKRERKYTEEAEGFIENTISDMENIKFLYIRYSFAIFRELSKGFYFLDHYVHQDIAFPPISSFQLLRNLRWYTLHHNKHKKDSARKIKWDMEAEKSEFYAKHKMFYENYIKGLPPKEQTKKQKTQKQKLKPDIQKVYNTKFNGNNPKIVKDMLVLTTKIKECYSNIWETNNA